MPTELIQIGPATPILQGVVYSIPSIPVEITAGAVVQSSILYTGPFTNISNGLMNGCFIKCVTGNTTVTLKKKVIGEAVTPPVAPSTLLNNLVSYWKLDETTGNRLDSKGTNHLTPTNAPVGAAGKIGNGCDFDSSSSQYLSHPDLNPLGNEDFTYTFWFKLESLIGLNTLIGKDHSSGRHYILQAEETGSVLRFTCNLWGGQVVASPGPLSLNTWYFAVLWVDKTAMSVNLQVNNGTIVSNLISVYTPPAGNVALDIGRREYPGFENYFDGLIDEVGLWRRVLTAQERTDLYNSGNGRTYPFS